jgi:hypothetical protein
MSEEQTEIKNKKLDLVVFFAFVKDKELNFFMMI